LKRINQLKIKLNGEEKNINSKINVLSLVNEYKLNPEAVIIEYNLNVLDKDKYENTYLKENDQIEIVKFIGGG